jgi:alkyldihydroxyacetonephosphate synthase
MIVGSEGTLGVIDELALRVRAMPRASSYEGVFFESFDAGVAALRELSREHVLPDVARLSDEEETGVSLALAGDGGLKGRLGRAYVDRRGYGAGCLAIFGFEGTPDDVEFRRGAVRSVVRRNDGLAVGGSPGEAWRHGRFAAPYLRDELLTHGVMVETLETASQWSSLRPLRERVEAAIAGALSDAGTPGIVMCHVSHVYETGASLYFTFIARQSEADPIGQWRAVKVAACDAIVAGGGTITHHHAVGRDHAPWMDAEIGPEGIAAVRALKAELDPAGIMNPGKLLPVSRG